MMGRERDWNPAARSESMTVQKFSSDFCSVYLDIKQKQQFRRDSNIRCMGELDIYKYHNWMNDAFHHFSKKKKKLPLSKESNRYKAFK